MLDSVAAGAPSTSSDTFEVSHTDAEWRQLLSPQQYDVLRTASTEAPFSSPLNDEHRPGIFGCAGCGLDLFSSTTKFDSGTGWPSFWKAMDNAVLERQDNTLGMTRTEVLCRRCGGHLGHVFDDGPATDRPALLHEWGGAELPIDLIGAGRQRPPSAQHVWWHPRTGDHRRRTPPAGRCRRPCQRSFWVPDSCAFVARVRSSARTSGSPASRPSSASSATIAGSVFWSAGAKAAMSVSM